MEWHKIIRKLQVDISSYCNAKCPGCARNKQGGDTKDFLSLNHFDVDIWNRLVEHDINGIELESLRLNGNWGDAGMHPQLPQMMEKFILHHPRTSIFIATNGGMQTTQWWEKLGHIMSASASHNVVFALDGLEDTNHIHRRNVRYNKVIENIQAFVKGNGIANIVFTVFDHNQHQIDDIIQLGKDLGCFEVQIRRSFKSYMPVKTDTENYAVTSAWEKQDYDVMVNDVEPISKLLPYEQVETKDTKCPWYNEGEVQIDPWHNVWPCCHISCNRFYDFNDDVRIVKEIGFDKFNLKHQSLREILDSNYYNKTLDEAVKDASWKVCRENCDVHIDK